MGFAAGTCALVENDSSGVRYTIVFESKRAWRLSIRFPRSLLQSGNINTPPPKQTTAPKFNMAGHELGMGKCYQTILVIKFNG
jgi:hypothetical protein